MRGVKGRTTRRAQRRAGALAIGLAAALLVVGSATGALASSAQAAPPVPAGTTVGYVVYDRTAEKTVDRSGEHRRFRSASLVKLLIALDYLYAKGSTSAVPDGDRTLLRSMLRSSDDDAASTLWVRGGQNEIISRMVERVGLEDTSPPTDPRYWGYTAMSPADVVAVYNHLLDKAPASYRDLIVGDLERYTRCAADGFDQSFGLPDAVDGRKAVKQGWSGYGAGPGGSACSDERDDTAPTADSAHAQSESSDGGASSGVDLGGRAMHTSGLVDGRSRVIVVMTLHPESRSYEDSGEVVTDITEALHDAAVDARS